MKKRLKRIESHIGEINITLAKQSVILEEHVKRSNMLEDALKPVEKHVSMMQGGLKLTGLIGVILGILKLIQELYIHG